MLQLHAYASKLPFWTKKLQKNFLGWEIEKLRFFQTPFTFSTPILKVKLWVHPQRKARLRLWLQKFRTSTLLTCCNFAQCHNSVDPISPTWQMTLLRTRSARFSVSAYPSSDFKETRRSGTSSELPGRFIRAVYSRRALQDSDAGNRAHLRSSAINTCRVTLQMTLLLTALLLSVMSRSGQQHIRRSWR